MTENKTPVYIIAHNPNTTAEADEVLAAGVNGLEPDIHFNEHTGDICISHDAPGSADNPPTVEDYLAHVKRQLPHYPGLSMILFDIKLEEPLYNDLPLAHWGLRLHSIANSILQDTGLALIYSVSKLTQLDVFTSLAWKLGPKEAIMVDQESDVDEVMDALKPLSDKGVRICYADGIYPYIPDLLGIAANVRSAIERRAEKGLPHFVGTWVLNTEHEIRKYLEMGVNGMIVTNPSIRQALDIVASPAFSGKLRLAEPADDPFLS